MRKLAAIALAVLAIGACAKNEITLVPDPTLAGHYALRTVGGDSLPYTVISQPGLVVTITADTISLEVSGSFTWNTHYSRNNAGVMDTPVVLASGTWSAAGNAVRMAASTGEVYTALVSGVQLTNTGTGIISLYSK